MVKMHVIHLFPIFMRPTIGYLCSECACGFVCPPGVYTHHRIDHINDTRACMLFCEYSEISKFIGSAEIDITQIVFHKVYKKDLFVFINQEFFSGCLAVKFVKKFYLLL